MTAATSVTITAPCPGCGIDCAWYGVAFKSADDQSGTRWDIACTGCMDWTWRGQVQRWMERRRAA